MLIWGRQRALLSYVSSHSAADCGVAPGPNPASILCPATCLSEVLRLPIHSVTLRHPPHNIPVRLHIAALLRAPRLLPHRQREGVEVERRVVPGAWCVVCGGGGGGWVRAGVRVGGGGRVRGGRGGRGGKGGGGGCGGSAAAVAGGGVGGVGGREASPLTTTMAGPSTTKWSMWTMWSDFRTESRCSAPWPTSAVASRLNTLPPPPPPLLPPPLPPHHPSGTYTTSPTFCTNVATSSSCACVSAHVL